jgi:DNA-binding LacI/PurR family transcriptional regulator
MRATTRTIAEEVGVSHVTVSHVLRGVDSRVSEQTRTRVLEAARTLNYIPVKPPTAQNHHIETGVVTFVPEHHDDNYFELDLFTFQGVVEGARRHGYDVLTMVRHEREKKGKREESRFLDRSSDGFIFNVILQEQWPRVLERLAQNRVPSVVCFHRDVPEGVAWVDMDNARAMRLAVEHLVANGHKRIAFVAGPTDNFHALQRHNAWLEAMREHELEVPDNFVVQGIQSVHGCIPDVPAVASVAWLGATAAVCFNDLTALAVWDAAQAQGVRVPDDLSLVGVDNRAEGAARGLSSIAHSFADVGRLAMDAWVELKNGADAACCFKLAPVEMVERGSVRDLQ